MLSRIRGRIFPMVRKAAAESRKQAIAKQLECLTSEAPIPEEQKQKGLAGFCYFFKYLLDVLPVVPGRRITVLEAGVGRYGWAHLFAKFFDTVYGLDVEDYSAYHPHVKFITADMTKEIPLEEQSVDLIVSYSVLEHVMDVPAALANFDRVLKHGGYLHLVVAESLYYCPRGSHIFQPRLLSNWEHLDPSSDYYLLDDPLPGAPTQGHVLNKMTYADFLGWLGRFPWSIVRSKLGIDPRPIPGFVDQGKWSEMQLRATGFNLVAQKEWHTADLARRMAAA
jgi:SAM-dependent methyltransferase